MKLIRYISFAFIFLIVACVKQPSPIKSQPEIEFYAPIQTTSENEVEISLQMKSTKADFEADPGFDGRMKLFDSNNELRAEAVTYQNPFMKKGELYQIVTWRGYLDPGEYQLTWSAPNYGGTQITFEVYEHDSGRFYIGDQTIRMVSPD